MTIDDLNAIDPDAAEREFLRCCGSVRWARTMTARRPFRDRSSMLEEADTIWRGLEASDWLEAFAAHPRIGESAQSSAWSAGEQAAMAAASAAVRPRLAAVNREYEQRFGFIYIVCATGKSAAEMLALAEGRLAHSRQEELRIAADEQRKITQLRLEKLTA